MIVYHLDRSKSLQSGQVLDKQHFDESYRASIDHVRFAEDLLFPGGFSQFGLSHFRDDIRFFSHEAPFRFPMALNEFSRHQEILSEYLREAVLECVRRLYYSSHPSRYECIFCVPDTYSLRAWLPILGSGESANIATLDISTSHRSTLDASILRSGLIFPTEAHPVTMYGFSPALLLAQAYRYWRGDTSDNPLLEILVPLPAKIVSVQSIESMSGK